MPLDKARITQLPGGWWQAKEVGGVFNRGAIADSAVSAWMQLSQQGLTLVPADEETRLWVVDARWNAVVVRDRPETGGKRLVTPWVRHLAEHAFGRVVDVSQDS